MLRIIRYKILRSCFFCCIFSQLRRLTRLSHAQAYYIFYKLFKNRSASLAGGTGSGMRFAWFEQANPACLKVNYPRGNMMDTITSVVTIASIGAVMLLAADCTAVICKPA